MLKIPDELSLLEFFESEPITAVPHDGFFCYKAVDSRGLALYFSFDVLAKSVQIRMEIDEQQIVCVDEEGADTISIESDASGEYIKCLFVLDSVARSKAMIHLRPKISVDWSTLLHFH